MTWGSLFAESACVACEISIEADIKNLRVFWNA